MINPQSSIRRICWSVLLLCTGLLSACDQSEPSSVQIKDYIESYQTMNDLKVDSMTYDIIAEKDNNFGLLQVSGQLELMESLYLEDEGNRSFRNNVAKMLRRNRFSDREINHEIYDRIVRASARVPGDENKYYTFLKLEHEAGLAINFSAALTYKMSNDGFLLDGPVRLAKLVGSHISKFSNPVIDDAKLTQKTVENVLSEQIRYRELMKENRAFLTQLWDNDFGFVIWNRKVPYLGNENLSTDEQSQLTELESWRGVYHISNIKPVQYRSPHASNFFELGSYTTEGIATCLRQTGFIDQLSFLKSKFDQYCEFGKQYPARINLGSWLGETNEFVAKVQFEVNGTDSGELIHHFKQFKRERNELARYSDQQRLTILKERFDIKHHNPPTFSTVDVKGDQPERLSLNYSGTSVYSIELDDRNGIEVAQNEENKSITSKKINSDASKVSDNYSEVLANDAIASGQAVAETDSVKTMTKKELVKAIQVELNRLGVYKANIDGVAGGYTYWGMEHVQQQLGKNNIKMASIEFLALLKVTPTKAIVPPVKQYSPPSDSTENKKNLVGNALRKTARWFGKTFGKKED